MNRAALRVARNIVLSVGVLALCEWTLRVRTSGSPPPAPAYALSSSPSLHSNRSTLWTADPWESRSEASRPLRILVCGDDDAVASDDHAWPRVLHRAIGRTVGTDAVVVRSIGIGGFTAIQGERALLAELEDRPPDIVLLHYGSFNEFQPAIESRSDRDWLESVAGVPSASGSRLLDAIKSAVDLPSPADRPASTVVRVDGIAFERALERMIAKVRRFGACPIVVEPFRRASSGAPDREDAIAAIYRQLAARVAGVYGAPFVSLEKALALDRGPFRSDSRRLSPRGAKVVARECLRTLIADTAVLIAIQGWFERNASAPESALVAGTLGMMHTVFVSGPAAIPSDTVIDVLRRAGEYGDPRQKRAACLRLALARHRGESITTTLQILDACSADEDPQHTTIRAALQILSGQSNEARARLNADTGHDGAIAATLRGMSLLTTDAVAAEAEFEHAIDLDPTLVLPDLWIAKSALIAGEIRTAELHCDLALRARDCHGSGALGFQIASSRSGRVAEFLNTDPILFGAEQRSALPRLLFALAIDSETRRPDAAAFLDRAYVYRDAEEQEAYSRALAQALRAGESADADILLTCGWLALERKDREVAREFFSRASSIRDHVETKFATAVLELESGAPQRALPLLEQVLAERPDDPRTLWRTATARFALGDLEGARRDVDRAATRWPNHPELIQLRERIENAANDS